MSDRADLAQMGEPELRAWLQKLPAEVQPKDLDAKMKDLKVKWFTGG